MSKFPLTTTLQVRSRDLDAQGHVNNTVYADYFEQVRTEYVREIIQPALDEHGMVLAQLEIEYHAPIHLDDEIDAAVRVSETGNTSFALKYRLETDDGVAATGTSVQVAIDAETGEGTSVPDGWRERINDVEETLEDG
jgi:acyl-CoA thioester hydrolase